MGFVYHTLVPNPWMETMRYGADPQQGYQPPIGVTALQDRPQQFKSWGHEVTHYALGSGGIHMRARSRLIQQGEGNATGWVNRTFLDSSFNRSAQAKGFIGQGRSAAEDFLRGEFMRANPTTWYKAPSMRTFNPNINRMEYQMLNKLNSNPTGQAIFKKIGLKTESDNTLRHLLDPHPFSRMDAAYGMDRKATKLGSDATMTAREKAGLRHFLSETDSTEIKNGVVVDPIKQIAGPGWTMQSKGGVVNALDESGAWENMTYREGAQLTRMSMKYGLSAKMGGFTEGITHGLGADGKRLALRGEIANNNPIASAAYKTGQDWARINDVYKLGGRAGLEEIASKGVPDLVDYAGKSVIGLGARSLIGEAAFGAAQFVPGLDVVVDAAAIFSTVHMVASFGAKAVAGAFDIGSSLMKGMGAGNVSRPMFGGAYHDTLAASTSRSRGVMAIQNSRLNARSVLGSEASYVHQHFG